MEQPIDETKTTLFLRYLALKEERELARIDGEVRDRTIQLLSAQFEEEMIDIDVASCERVIGYLQRELAHYRGIIPPQTP